ncbi:hypothetical protein LTR66_017203 [Elasticomyces elasticus]|nr:hypothetical protein LTR66_017203 [Elasticomyces elasticus]
MIPTTKYTSSTTTHNQGDLGKMREPRRQLIKGLAVAHPPTLEPTCLLSQLHHLRPFENSSSIHRNKKHELKVWIEECVSMIEQLDEKLGERDLGLNIGGIFDLIYLHGGNKKANEDAALLRGELMLANDRSQATWQARSREDKHRRTSDDECSEEESDCESGSQDDARSEDNAHGHLVRRCEERSPSQYPPTLHNATSPFPYQGHFPDTMVDSSIIHDISELEGEPLHGPVLGSSRDRRSRETDHSPHELPADRYGQSPRYSADRQPDREFILHKHNGSFYAMRRAKHDID